MNPELARYLSGYPKSGKHPARTLSCYPHHTARLRVRERLGQQNIAALVAAFRAGTPKHVLAQHYGINEKSVKQLLTEEGVKKRSRYERLE